MNQASNKAQMVGRGPDPTVDTNPAQHSGGKQSSFCRRWWYMLIIVLIALLGGGVVLIYGQFTQVVTALHSSLQIQEQTLVRTNNALNALSKKVEATALLGNDTKQAFLQFKAQYKVAVV